MTALKTAVNTSNYLGFVRPLSNFVGPISFPIPIYEATCSKSLQALQMINISSLVYCHFDSYFMSFWDYIPRKKLHVAYMPSTV